MHLILAVVPDPVAALQEAQRVLKPHGKILILDKFLHPNKRAPLRRLLNPMISRIATRTDVVFEEILRECKELEVLENTPSMLGGWFRHITLQKKT
jgi:ubiquinone/menaquinone biosynthesis C-methylase UbiE